MKFVRVESAGGVATVVLERGKVNALNATVVEELSATFGAILRDAAVSAVVLTGHGKFFSFGFDVPEFLSYSKEDFAAFLTRFASFYRDLFIFPKPVVAALNGHAIAGGCMIALACDRVTMAEGSAKIGLNEIGFGSSVFAGSVEMLQFRTGPRAADVLYSGAMFSPVEAQKIGLIDDVVTTGAVLDRAREIATEVGSRRPAAFASLKSLLRTPVADAMAVREAASIREFVDIWYSEPTRTNLRNITIR